MNLTLAPLQQQPVGPIGYFNQPWALWFRDVARLLGFPMAAYGSFTPSFTGLNTVGTYTTSGTYTRARNQVWFSVSVSGVSGGTTASVSGGTTLTLPATDAAKPANVVRSSAYGFAQVIDMTTGSAVGAGRIQSGDTKLYLPTWAATSDTIAIMGVYLVDDT